jgi:hypothetical protein
MVTLDTVLNVIPVVTLVLVGAYYSLQIRNQNRARQAQLFMQLYETYRNPEFRKLQISLSRYEFTDFKDFWGKYGVDVNPDAWSSWLAVAAYYNGIGVLVKKNLISIDLVEELLSNVRIENMSLCMGLSIWLMRCVQGGRIRTNSNLSPILFSSHQRNPRLT